MKQCLMRSAGLTKYEEVARSVGLNPYHLLQAVGLSPSLLTEQDAWIPTDKFYALMEKSARAAGVDDFGLRIAETRRLSNLGVIALVVREEPTIRKALDFLVTHAHLQNESLLVNVDEADKIATISVTLFSGKVKSVRQSMELAVGVVYRFLCELSGGGWKPLRVCFMHSAPTHVAAHNRVFGPHVEFDRDFNGIVCLVRDLDATVPTSDPVIARYMKQYLDSSFHRQNPTPANKVRQLVWMLLPSGRCSVGCVAQHLCVDRRTVHRHLSRSGETFSSIVQSVRMEMVLRYVENSGRSLSKVADLLGFSSSSTFSRWFHTNFGCTASCYRAKRNGQRVPHATAGESGDSRL